jgi:hypothetical protein
VRYSWKRAALRITRRKPIARTYGGKISVHNPSDDGLRREGDVRRIVL